MWAGSVCNWILEAVTLEGYESLWCHCEDSGALDFILACPIGRAFWQWSFNFACPVAVALPHSSTRFPFPDVVLLLTWAGFVWWKCFWYPSPNYHCWLSQTEDLVSLLLSHSLYTYLHLKTISSLLSSLIWQVLLQHLVYASQQGLVIVLLHFSNARVGKKPCK